MHDGSSNSNEIASHIWASSGTNSQVKEKLTGQRGLLLLILLSFISCIQITSSSDFSLVNPSL